MFWATKIANSKKNIYYLTSLCEGEEVFYFIDIDKTKESIFLKALRSNAQIDLQFFGKVLEKGFGRPSNFVKKRLKNLYDYEVQP